MPTTCTVLDPKRRDLWLKHLENDTLPIKSLIPTPYQVGERIVLAYQVDLEHIPELREKLIALYAERRGCSQRYASAALAADGLAILASHTSVTTDDPEAVAALL